MTAAENGATIESLLSKAAHLVYHAQGLFHEPIPGVRMPPALEPGLANPIRIAYAGTAETQVHRPVAMLGAKWYRDVTRHEELFFDHSDQNQRAQYNNRGAALTIPLITGEHATKLILTHKRTDSKPGAHLIYTVFTKEEAHTRALHEKPELLCELLTRIATLPNLKTYDLKKITLTRPLHYAHPTDLSSDPKLQKAFKAYDFVKDTRALYERALALQSEAQQSIKDAETARAASIANLTLLEGVKTTERRRATQAFDTLKDAQRTKEQADAERRALESERAKTKQALSELDSRDEKTRAAATAQIRKDMERVQTERDDYRTKAEGLEGELATRDAALVEAAETVTSLANQVEELTKKLNGTGG